MAHAKHSPSPRISIRKYSRMLSRYLRPQGWLVAALAAAILSNIALQLISPQILRRFVDAATSARSERSTAGAGPAVNRRVAAAAGHQFDLGLPERDGGLERHERPARQPGGALHRPGHVFPLQPHPG